MAETQSCYEKAIVNPAFSAENDEALSVLLVMPVKKLEQLVETDGARR